MAQESRPELRMQSINLGWGRRGWAQGVSELARPAAAINSADHDADSHICGAASVGFRVTVDGPWRSFCRAVGPKRGFEKGPDPYQSQLLRVKLALRPLLHDLDDGVPGR